MKELLRKLIQAETTAEKGELAAAEIISDELGRSGIDCRIDSWGLNSHRDSLRRANLTALVTVERAVAGQVTSASAVLRTPYGGRLTAGRKGGLLFLCHLDVVAAGEGGWRYPAFAGVESEGKIYGRGSVDMKGGIAATVTAIREIVDSGAKLKGDIIFFAAAGEETDSCGTKRFISDLNNKLPKIAGVVIPEPTDFEVVTAHRGMLWLEVITKGKAAHSSAPQLGINAISSMKSFLDEFQNYKIAAEAHELLGDCSMSINTIFGGKEINVIPDKCSIGVDIRTLPSQNTRRIIDDLESIVAKLKQKNPKFDAEVAVIREVDALETDSNCDFVRGFCSAVGVSKTKAVGFTTDGPYFASLGAPVVIFGPGKPQLAHKPDEYINIADVEKAVEYYKKVILKFLT